MYTCLSHVLRNIQRTELSTFLYTTSCVKFSISCALQQTTSHYDSWQCNILKPYRILGQILQRTVKFRVEF